MPARKGTTKASTEESKNVEVVDAKPVEVTAKPVSAEKPADTLETVEVETRKVPEQVKTSSATKKTTTAKKTTAVKKGTGNKETVSKKVTSKKTSDKSAPAVKQEVYVQFEGREILANDILEHVKSIWINEMGRKQSEMKEIKLYMKPEEFTAYYVINGDITGSVDL